MRSAWFSFLLVLGFFSSSVVLAKPSKIVDLKSVVETYNSHRDQSGIERIFAGHLVGNDFRDIKNILSNVKKLPKADLTKDGKISFQGTKIEMMVISENEFLINGNKLDIYGKTGLKEQLRYIDRVLQTKPKTTSWLNILFPIAFAEDLWGEGQLPLAVKAMQLTWKEKYWDSEGTAAFKILHLYPGAQKVTINCDSTSETNELAIGTKNPKRLTIKTEKGDYNLRLTLKNQTGNNFDDKLAGTHWNIESTNSEGMASNTPISDKDINDADHVEAHFDKKGSPEDTVVLAQALQKCCSETPNCIDRLGPKLGPLKTEAAPDAAK